MTDTDRRAGLSPAYKQLIGRAFRVCRAAAGMPQGKAAERLGVSNVHLCNVERGHTGPSLSLCIDAGSLYGWDPYIVAARLHRGLKPFREEE